VGIKQGTDLAKMELQLLLAQYQLIQGKFDELNLKLDELIEQIPGLAIKGIGRDTVAGFLAEIGDIGNYHHPKQIVKLAGLNLRENTSGKIKDSPR
jgi:transposase